MFLSTSANVRCCCAAISSAVTTVTLLASSASGVGMRVAVTTISCSASVSAAA